MFVVFEIYEVKDRPVLAPKIPYYVTYDLDFNMMNWDCQEQQFRFLHLEQIIDR